VLADRRAIAATKVLRLLPAPNSAAISLLELLFQAAIRRDPIQARLDFSLRYVGKQPLQRRPQARVLMALGDQAI
jgi:hypothetical protein